MTISVLARQAKRLTKEFLLLKVKMTSLATSMCHQLPHFVS